MSLGIAIKGPEGLVLAAESRLTLVAQSGDQQHPPLHLNYDNATKLFSFAEPHNHVGVITYGLAAMQTRSAYSFVPELEVKLPGKRRDTRDYAELLSRFYGEQWRKLVPVDYAGPGMTFVVAGFNHGEPYGHVYVIEIPKAVEPHELHSAEGQFGITWGGQREIVDLLVKGYDHRVLDIIQKLLGPEKAQMEELEKALESVRTIFPIDVLPLQDCVDLALLFMRTTIEAQRLSVGMRGCGGPVDVGTITRADGFHFVQRKEIQGEAVRPVQ